jgi:hypothetical protein
MHHELAVLEDDLDYAVAGKEDPSNADGSVGCL